MRIKFIVLACSYKHKNRCVAGIDLNNERLIRLVSENSGTNYAIPKEECYINGRPLKPLDIIDVEIAYKARSRGAQTENYVVEFPLVRAYCGKADIGEIKPYRFKGNTPYPFGTKDAFISRGAYFYKDYSLCLIPAYSLTLNNVENSEGNSKTKITFDVYKYTNEKITLFDYSVTDPEFAIFNGFNAANKTHLGKAWLLISLGQEDGSDNYFKFVSGIIDATK